MTNNIFRLYIDGRWLQGESTISNISPADLDDVVGDYAQASSEQTLQAIAYAKKGQQQWALSGLELRYSVLMAIGSELIDRKDELGRLLSREEGKILSEGCGEVYRAGQFFQYYAAEVLRQMGETAISVRPNIAIETYREPVGVVGVITPWNFPMATAAWKIAPALAYGNSVVFKPANQVPASAWALTEIISRQNLPAGTFNLVMGSGAKVGETIIHSPDIQALTFTGSLDVGRKIVMATAKNLVKCQLEMGSKNGLVILDDADLFTAVDCAVSGAFYGTGQKCTASSRLIVTESIHDQFVEALIDKMKTLVIGHPLKEGVHIGSVADCKQMSQNLRYLEIAKKEGAILAYGGDVVQENTRGYYLQPALFVNTHNEMTINKEEMFAPIATVIKVKDYEAALSVLNDTEYGLTAGIITQSLHYANDFKKRAQVGCVMINLPTAGTDYHVPFGGRKHSSYGSREQGSYAKEFYTIVKTSYMQS